MSTPQQQALLAEMAAVERELDGRVEHALSRARDVARQAAELDRRTGPLEPPTDEEVGRIRDFVVNHGRTEEWERVIRRIDAGQLTWREVVASLTTGRVDREVAAAFSSLSRITPVGMEEMIEAGTFPAMPADEPPAPAAEDGPPARPRRPRVADLADEDFYGNPLRRDDEGW